MSVLNFDCRFHYQAGFSLEFSFAAEQGVTALVGPSGAGKTTVLNLIAGLLTPQDGTISLGNVALFDSHSATNLPPNQRAVGYVFQDYQLFPHLSVEQNLRYGQRRTPGGTVSFDKIVATLELAALLPRPPASLSGGQQQRVAVGRALLRSPRLLLLDEPLNALDADLRRSIADYLGRVIAEFHIPSVMVSHDRESVASLASAVVTIGR
jgi:molybdate transport system ATP-binding protein